MPRTCRASVKVTDLRDGAKRVEATFPGERFSPVNDIDLYPNGEVATNIVNSTTSTRSAAVHACVPD